MGDIKKAYDDLFYRIAVGKLKLEFIEDLLAFCNHFKSHKDFADYRIKARSDMSMVYSQNEIYAKSFDLDMEFLQENHILHPEYFIIIGRIARTSSTLMRTDEVKNYINKFITYDDVKHILPKLPLLDWYTFYYPDEIKDNKNFEKVLLEIIRDLGAPVFDELILAKRIKNINILYEESGYNLSYFHQAYRRAAPEQRVSVLKEYLSKTPLRYYRDIMKRDAEKMNN